MINHKGKKWVLYFFYVASLLARVVFYSMVTGSFEDITHICFCTFVVFDIHCCLRLQQQWDQLLVATQSSMVQRRQPSHGHRLCAKIHTSTYAGKKNPTRHNFAEIISRVVQLRPSTLCERQEGANDLLPLISNLPTPEPGVHSPCMCVYVCV